MFRRRQKTKKLRFTLFKKEKDGELRVRVKASRRVQRELGLLADGTPYANYPRRLLEVAARAKEKKRGIEPLPLALQTFVRLRVNTVRDRPVDERRFCSAGWEKCYPFQKEGIRHIVSSLNGKALLCDEMGLGKSLQALVVASYFVDFAKETLLLVCPSYLRHNWKDELLKWKLVSKPNAIQVIRNGKQKIEAKPGVIIVSYGLVPSQARSLFDANPTFAILDESHYIKNRKAKRTKAVARLVGRIKKILCLSGTPALSRPAELFTQLRLVAPTTFTSFSTFAERYCDAKMGPFGWDVSGISNKEELQIVLAAVMVRRLKKKVLTQLPPKRRECIRMEIAPKLIEKYLKPLFGELAALNRLTREDAFQQKCLVSQLFCKTAEAKVQMVKDWLRHSLFPHVARSEKKVLVFAHHLLMLDAIQSVAEKAKIGFIRIDGSTPQEKRLEQVETFRNDRKTLVAILSIGACGTGLNLTMAAHVVFVELKWNPGELLQCEDRTHRIGQVAESILIQYLIAKKTLDENVWNKLATKFKNLDCIVDQNENTDGFDADEILGATDQGTVAEKLLIGGRTDRVQRAMAAVYGLDVTEETGLVDFLQQWAIEVSDSFIQTYFLPEDLVPVQGEGEGEARYFVLLDSKEKRKEDDILFYPGVQVAYFVTPRTR